MTTPKTDHLTQLEQRLAALNHNKIDLGLDRLKRVVDCLDLLPGLPQVITVGGTNGKGSTVAALSSLLNAQAKSYGAFTSPHIFKFNERLNINGQLASDAEILQSFTAIDAAKGSIDLSYFEYAFLTAVLLFKQHDVDVMLMEVGLGGRLDAANVLDADVCVITTVDLDHMSWLGDDIESIAYEKAGIMRSNRPVVFGDFNPPVAIESYANEIKADLIMLDKDYQFKLSENTFSFQYLNHTLNDLQRPQLKGDWQIKNFSSALTALITLGYQFSASQLQQALDSWQIKGRMQTIQPKPEVIADVAHNRQSAQQLAQYLKSNPIKGNTRAVFSVLQDKQVDTWLNDLAAVIDHWFVFELADERALDGLELKSNLADHVTLFSYFNSAQQAYQAALQCSEIEDRIIVFGSFHVLEAVFQENDI